MSKHVAVKENTAMACAINFEMDAGAGMEAAKAADFAIPFLGVIQSLSPQRNKQKSEYIPGANEGQIFNSINGELFDGEEGITVLPCKMVRTWIEWNVREEGGGLCAIHESPDGIQTVRDDRGRDRVIDENGEMTGRQLSDTFSFYVLAQTKAGTWNEAVINMSSTQLKKAKRWNTMIMQNLSTSANGVSFVLPMYSTFYHLTTVPESNDQGAWHGWSIAKGGMIEDEALYSKGKRFSESVDVKAVV